MNIFFNWFVIESVPKILFHIQQDLHTVFQSRRNTIYLAAKGVVKLSKCLFVFFRFTYFLA